MKRKSNDVDVECAVVRKVGEPISQCDPFKYVVSSTLHVVGKPLLMTPLHCSTVHNLDHRHLRRSQWIRALQLATMQKTKSLAERSI